MKTLRASLSSLLILALVITSLPVVAATPAASELMSTQSVLASDQAGSDRQRISDVLARADVQQALLNQG
ncbi:DUF6627 family protein, partial [Halomonas sp. 707D7]|nr:hypothetical protein [Halomonas sp. 707D7]